MTKEKDPKDAPKTRRELDETLGIKPATALDRPWMDVGLSEETMNSLWDNINNASAQEIDANGRLAGNISKSKYIQDKDNWFYNNVLKGMAEHLYYKNWVNYYDVVITKNKPRTEFFLHELWVNYQKQHEFNPPHQHSAIYSFVVFMKIPTHSKEQHALPFSAHSGNPVASDFQFLVGNDNGQVQPVKIPLNPEDNGRMLFFPGWLTHQVLPFYGTEEERITISGNIYPLAFFKDLADQKKIDTYASAGKGTRNNE